jgi:hypothetical protein
MNRKLAKELKAAGFSTPVFQVGHKFYPHEKSAGWSDASQKSGVTITPYELQNHARDIEDGYYCPNLPDLIEACGKHFARLYVEATIWTAQSDNPRATAMARSAEEAVARLWLALRNKKT